jgi:RNA polymerase sigma-70 factor (ECF subfamily)
MSEDALAAALRRVRVGGADPDRDFRQLDAVLRPRLFAYFRASFGPEDAEDLVQRTLVRVCQGIGAVREEEKLFAWLFTVARNVRNSAFERRPPRGVPLDSVPEPADPHEIGDGVDERREKRREALWRAIEALPPRQRQCLPLQVRDGLSYEEIAATLRLSVNTVRNHLAAARESLKRVLAAEGLDE